MIKGFHVVLVEPEIPNNTGNIGRLCVATESRLHLIHPLGFQIDDSRVKRAGLDYWPELDLVEHESFDHWLEVLPEGARLHFFSSHGLKSLYDTELKSGDWLVFGKESKGLDSEIKNRFSDNLIRIPFNKQVRSFNLGNTVAMCLGEGMRQNAM